MVTFRFYVVSIVAFFLALAVGVLIGSVLDGRIADGLQDRLDGVEASLDEAVALADAKKLEIERQERYIEASAPYAVEDRVEASSSLVVAESGVDDVAVLDLVDRLRQGGSAVEGIVWLEPRMELDDRADRRAAASLLDLDEAAGAGELRAALWRTLSGADVERAASTSTTAAPETTVPTVTTVPAGEERIRFDDPVLSGLADAGLVRLQSVDGDGPVEGGELLLVAVTGTASQMRVPGESAAALARTASAAGVPTVLAEVTAVAAEGQPERRGELLADARSETPVRFSTVDDLELLSGRVATVLALADAREGTLGRYGYGPDVDAVLPPWPGP